MHIGRWLGLAGILVLGIRGAGAVTFCVHDNAEFGSALFTAATNGTLDTVKLAQGTYTLSSDIFYNANAGEGGLVLSGGWDNGCLLRSAAAANTVIDGSNTYGPDFYTAGALALDALHFYRF